MEWLLIVGLVMAFAFGRASKPQHRVQFFNAKLEAQERYGYRMARIKVGPGLDDVLLALHRIDGQAKAMADNMADVKEVVNNFGQQDEKAAADEQRP